MNRSARSWIEGDVHEIMDKLMYEAGPVTVIADDRDEQDAGIVQRLLGKLRKLLQR